MASWTEAGAQTSTLNRVLGLLGLAAIVTAAGAFVGPVLGLAGLWVGLIGGLVLVFALRFVRNVSPLNIILLVVFSPLEGIVLGDVLEVYVAQGMSVVVFQAAAATAVAAFAAGGIGYFTKRDLTRFGGYLFIALIVVVVAS